MITDKTALFNKAPLKREAVEVEALGGEQIEITEMTLAARAEVMPLLSEGRQGEISAKVLRRCVPALAKSSEKEIADKLAPKAAEELTTAIFRLSGLLEDNGPN